MSMSKYFKNFILCGEVDYLCLLCCENFISKEELEKHIRWEKHRKLIKSQTCFPKLRKESIFKIEQYFYCEHCNYAVEGFTNIKSHTETETHKNNKTNPENFPKRLEGRYIDTESVVINDYKVNTLQWHGMIHKRCVFCESIVQNVAEHMSTTGHIVKLIQSVLHSEDDNNKIYRKVNTDEYQCLTCKKTFPVENFDDHWNNHDEPQQMKYQEINDRIVVKQNNKLLDDEIKDYEYDVRTLNVTEDVLFDIDLENNKVTCKVCKEVVKVCKRSVFEHCRDHSKNGRKYIKSQLREAIRDAIAKQYISWKELDHGKARADAANYGRQHYIKMNIGGIKGYCTICDRQLSASVQVFKEHVEGKYHIGHLELKGLIKPRKHIKSAYRSDDIVAFLNEFGYSSSMKRFWINADFVIDWYSFFLMKKIAHGDHFKKTKCFACDQVMKWGEEKKHCLTSEHRNKVMGARVISKSSLPVKLNKEGKPRLNCHEFIREIRPKLFHCGYCNVSLPYFETVHQHVFNLGHEILRYKHEQAEALNAFVNRHCFRPTYSSIDTNLDRNGIYMQCFTLAFGPPNKVLDSD